MPTLEQRPNHVLQSMAARERRAADTLDYDATRHHRACCRIVEILAARRAGVAHQVRSLRVEALS